ncbi:hypothetical protein BDR22DRAFT_827865 [Usnea florida]
MLSRQRSKELWPQMRSPKLQDRPPNTKHPNPQTHGPSNPRLPLQNHQRRSPLTLPRKILPTNRPHIGTLGRKRGEAPAKPNGYRNEPLPVARNGASAWCAETRRLGCGG